MHRLPVCLQKHCQLLPLHFFDCNAGSTALLAVETKNFYTIWTNCRFFFCRQNGSFSLGFHPASNKTKHAANKNKIFFIFTYT